MSAIDLLFAAALVVIVLAFLAILLLTHRDGKSRSQPSPWQYGSGAYHADQPLPPVSQSVTSAPTGSAEPGHWPASRAVPNRPARHD